MEQAVEATIIKCSYPDDWYKDMIGETILVKSNLSTLSAETLDGKRISFYDLKIKWKSA